VALLALCLPLCGEGFSQDRARERERLILQIQQSFSQGDLAGARRRLDEAAKLFPADAGLDNLSGVIAAQEGNYAEAERSFGRAVARDRKFIGAYLNLGRLYQEHAAEDPQALSKALDVYGRALQYEPNSAEANYQSAALLMRKGDYRASLDRVSRLPAEIQEAAQCLSVRLADYAGLGDRPRADEITERLLKSPEFSEPDVTAALPALADGGRDDLSVALLEGLRKRGTLPADLARRLGLAYERAGKLAEARGALEGASAGEKPSAPLLVELARVAHKQKDYQGALGYLAHARDLDAKDASLSYFFGLVCLDLDLLAEARAAFEIAVNLEPENPAYNYAMGAASAFRRDPSEAIPYFEKYVRLKPRDPRGKLALGAALFKAKQYDAAAKTLAEAARNPDAATTARYYLGAIARQNGRLDEAERELRQALQARPDYTDALAELGQCYAMKKEYEAAGKLLRRALEIDPNHYAANFSLLALYARSKDEREAAQAARFEEVKKLREEKAQEFLRMVEARPYTVP
jgi:tetratricopeptide (TPR) repeat protein